VLFFISIVSFFVSGIGLEILLTASLIFGFFFLAHIRLLAVNRKKGKEKIFNKPDIALKTSRN